MTNTRQLALRFSKEWKVYIFHCMKCHHEWERAEKDKPQKCDWCGAEGRLLDESFEIKKPE